jgi:hypothetical protein
MLYKLDYSPGKITAVSCHFPATFRQVITSPPDAGPSPVFSYQWFWTQNYPAKSGKTICIRPKEYIYSLQDYSEHIDEGEVKEEEGAEKGAEKGGKIGTESILGNAMSESL